MSQPLLFESHSHTPLCKHAWGEPEQYAARAAERGLRGLHVTCHNPMPDGFGAHVRMAEEEFDAYIELVARTTERWAGRLDVRLGLEADYFPGYESWLERQLNSADFHYVLGSVHPQLAEYQAAYWDDNPRQVQQTYFAMLAQSAETGLFDCLAHPDLIKNRTADHWQPSAILDDIKAALDRVAATGVAMELNTSGVNKRVAEMNPGPEILREIRARDIPVVLGADAHVPERVADGYETALELLMTCGFDEVSFFLARQRQTLPIAATLESLRQPDAIASDAG